MTYKLSKDSKYGSLNTIQKVFLLVMILTAIAGFTMLVVVNVYGAWVGADAFYHRQEVMLGVIVASVAGIYLFRNKKED
jgi:glucose uptake protein GlcU